MNNEISNRSLIIFLSQQISLVDTNEDCSVLVFDAHYMVEFRTKEVAEHILFLAYQLRTSWRQLLDKRISRGLGEVTVISYVLLESRWMTPHLSRL